MLYNLVLKFALILQDRNRLFYQKFKVVCWGTLDRARLAVRFQSFAMLGSNLTFEESKGIKSFSFLLSFCLHMYVQAKCVVMILLHPAIMSISQQV